MDLNGDSLPLVSTFEGTAITHDSEQIHGLEGPWEYVEAPGPEIDTGASRDPHKEDGDTAPLLETNDFHPIKPSDWAIDVYGIADATEKAHDRWLKLAAEAICSGKAPKPAQTYRDCARSYNLLPKLERQVLIYDIEISSDEVQKRLCQNFVLLLLSLDDHHCENTQIHLVSDREGLITRLLHALRIPLLPKRPKDDEVQTTSLVRTLLELSGGRIDCQQHEHSKAPTTDKTAKLLASVFEVTTVKGLRNASANEIAMLISQSPVFPPTKPQDLHSRTMTIRRRLRLEPEEGHLNLPPQVLVGFKAEQVNEFCSYLSHTYHDIPTLESPQNNQLLLLTWATKLSSLQDAASCRHFDIIQDWARSDDGLTLYNEIARSVQDSQSVQQLALTTAAMLSYFCLVPDNLDHSSRPFTGSYLADLDNHFRGHVLGNRGSVAGRMAFALIRVLLALGDQYGGLATFLVAAVDREPPMLHALDGLSDQYFNFRVRGYDHEQAFYLVNTEAPWSPSESRSIRVARTVEESYETEIIDDSLPTEVAHTFSPVADRIPAPPHFPPDNYKLVCLSNVKEEEVTRFFDLNIEKLSEVPSVEPVGDGSYEIVVLDSHCDILRNRVNASLPDSKFELDYDPSQPTDADLQNFGSEQARQLRQQWFFERAIRIVAKGWSPAAAYYARRLELLCSFKTVAESH